MKRYYNGLRLATNSDAIVSRFRGSFMDTRGQRLDELLTGQQAADMLLGHMGVPAFGTWPRCIQHPTLAPRAGAFAEIAEKMAQIGRWR